MSTPQPTPSASGNLDRSNVQGIGLAGFRKPNQHLTFVQFGSDVNASRRLIRRLAPLVANDDEVSRFNSLYSEIRRRRGSDRQSSTTVSATWIGVGLSAVGYQSLGIDVTADGLPDGESRNAFVAGMAARAAQTGDVGGDAPDSWRKGMAGTHAVVVIASDNVDDMRLAIARIEDMVSDCDAVIVHSETGKQLAGEQRGREHFGFRDGVSQPSIVGYDDGQPMGGPAPVPVGEFVLGYPDALGQTATGALFVNGSYLVIRRLVQDVDAFHAQGAAGGQAVGVPPEMFEAKMVGRWPSGAPLEGNPTADPGDSGVTNDFTYSASGDDDGHLTPQWSHVRKVNPRDETQPQPPDDPAQHRMIRRGIPFHHGDERGLHFISVISDLDRQFEFVQRRWSDDANFPNGGMPAALGDGYSPPATGTPPAGPDPISGHRGDGAQVAYVGATGSPTSAVSLAHQFVRVTGGEYFFAPSISALEAMGRNDA